MDGLIKIVLTHTRCSGHIYVEQVLIADPLAHLSVDCYGNTCIVTSFICTCSLTFEKSSSCVLSLLEQSVLSNLVKHGLIHPQPMLSFTQWLIEVLYVLWYTYMQGIAAANDLA